MTHRSHRLLASLCVALFACESHTAPPPDLARSVPVDAAQPSADPAALTWTAPAIVARLAKQCSFDPDKLPAAERAKLYGVDPTLYSGDQACDDCPALTCSANIWDQSCGYDPCFDEGESKCKPSCVKSCDTCAQGCVATCTPCEAKCTDDACRHACAIATASCRQSCLGDRDHCATGTCAATYKACSVKLKAKLLAAGCDKVCKKLEACIHACAANSTYGSCERACGKAATRRGSVCTVDACDLLD